MKVKSKNINVRVDKALYDFVTDMARNIGLERSELVRRILEYHFITMFLGKQPKESLGQMRKEFIKKYKEEL